MRSALPAPGRFRATRSRLNDRALALLATTAKTTRLRTWRIHGSDSGSRLSLEADRMNTLMSRARPNCLAVLFGLASTLTVVRAQQAPSSTGQKNNPGAAQR